MGFFDNIFGSSDAQYPTQRTGQVPDPCGIGPYQAPDSDGFFNKLFAPTPVAYPVPACGSRTLGGGPGNAGGAAGSASACPGGTPMPPTPVPVSCTPATSTGSAPSSTPPPSSTASAAPVSPVTVVIAGPWTAPAAGCPSAPSDSGSTPAPSPAPPPAPAAATPVESATPTVIAGKLRTSDDPPPQQPVILTAVSSNPRFRAHHASAQEGLIEELIDEALNARMVTKNSTSLAFVVPDGCDSVEFFYGPIELGEHGKDGDLDLVVAVGEAQIVADQGNVDGTGLGPLLPGSALMVAVPWRAASFVSLSANHLQVTLYARFYSAIQPLSSAS